MTTQPDYYRILQVNPMAEREVINAAYRRLATKYHPDVSRVSDAAERMKQINIAYEVLSDPGKRAAYDASWGAARSANVPPHSATNPQHVSKSWRLLPVVALIVIAVLAVRLGPAILLLVARFVLPLVAIGLVVWLFFTLAKPKR